MKNLCKFRWRSHNLPVNNGRFIEVTQADLKCRPTLCKNGDVGDEYHYVCVCVPTERTKFVGNGMIMNPLTYTHLLNSRNIQVYWYTFLKACRPIWKILTEM